MKHETVQPTPAGRALSLPSPELVRVVDRLLSPNVARRLNRIVDMFQWEKRPTVPESLGLKVLQEICSGAAIRNLPDPSLWMDATGAPEFYGVPDRRKHDPRTAMLQVLQHRLNSETFYNNVPLAMSHRIPLLLYPRICGYIMSLSSGYASPNVAARIFASARTGTNRYGCCEWTNACYSRSSDSRTPDQLCLADAVRHLARKAGRSYGFYGGYRDKLILILQELLIEGGVPHMVDHVGPNA